MSCQLCLKELRDYEPYLVRTRCSHVFHNDCVWKVDPIFRRCSSCGLDNPLLAISKHKLLCPLMYIETTAYTIWSGPEGIVIFIEDNVGFGSSTGFETTGRYFCILHDAETLSVVGAKCLLRLDQMCRATEEIADAKRAYMSKNPPLEEELDFMQQIEKNHERKEIIWKKYTELMKTYQIFVYIDYGISRNENNDIIVTRSSS